MAEIHRTIRNNVKLSYNGFIYHLHVKKQTKTFWACIYRSKCRGRVFSVNIGGELEIQLISEHSHQPEPKKVAFLKIKSILERKAMESPVDPSELVRVELENLSKKERALLPSKTSLKRIVRLFRSHLTMADLVIPAEHFNTSSGSAFLLSDDIIYNKIDGTVHRTIIFATETNLRNLFNSDIWYADGTFEIKPTLFEQLWTIQGKVNDYSVPLVYVFMQTNDEDEYVQVLLRLVQKADEYKIASQPHTVLVDFNSGAASALKRTFPSAKVCISLLHFSQSLCSKMQVVMKSVEYTEAAKNWLRTAVGLAYIHTNDAEKSIELLLKQIDKESGEHFDRIREVAQFLDTHYVRGVRTHNDTWSPPHYPVCMWNMYERALNGDTATDAIAEEWYLKFSRLVRKNRASMHLMADAIKAEQKLTEDKLRKLIAGIEIPSKIVTLKNDGFKNCVRRYKEFQSQEKILEYCRMIGSFSIL